MFPGSFILKGERVRPGFRPDSTGHVLIPPFLQSFTSGPGQDIYYELGSSIFTWEAGFPEMGHDASLMLTGSNPFRDGLGTRRSFPVTLCLGDATQPDCLRVHRVVTHGRASFSLRLLALLRYGHAAFHYACILGSSVCQWRAACGLHTFAVVDNGAVDRGSCVSPGGPDIPFSRFTCRNYSKENSFSSALVVKNSPANPRDSISVFLDISRVHRRYTCY